MDASDGPEVCELVVIYMFNLLAKKCNINDLGLYRDDGLTVLENKSGSQSEQVRKNIESYLTNMG